MVTEGVKITDLNEGEIPVVEVITEATPIDDSVKQKVEDIEDIASKIQDVIDSFEDDVKEEEPKRKSAQDYLKSAIAYIQSKGFSSDIKEKAKLYNVPQKKLATSVIGKIFGVLGDTLELGVDAVRCGITGIVNLVSRVLNGATELICNVASKIARILTFNMTAYAYLRN